MLENVNKTFPCVVQCVICYRYVTFPLAPGGGICPPVH